ncbi:uncharacterized protein MONBRDRAFT_14693 [Monosiga brevicollis MX1]|uniref:NADAR domain-containing protein n=1 Tax=Monosiga brevicollis TaxID=81824 RepID=A9URT7_MONBE|nr:uncharacterized protein MONBRDRAFT_14693 [Monosiga brevicollis MX1]EDQ91664.1 predicted protein [Monosiga brevicollis MX1]|eukprot:XP_001742950.1 hypothetical protein [Monosiga brevicollis MX1]
MARFVDTNLGRTFSCVEQYMMYRKAILFGDAEYAEAIMEATTPREHKALGRHVRNFDEETWKAHRREIVRSGVLLKFAQNPELKAELLSHPAHTVFVEASPRDRIWGIGLDVKNPACHDPQKWRGLNLLGQALTEAAEQLRQA